MNGSRGYHRHAHAVKSVTLRKLPKKRFTVKIVAISNHGDRIVTKRRYKGCTKGHPSTRVHRHKHKKKGSKPRLQVVGLRR